MELESVKRFLEGGGEHRENASKDAVLPERFIDSFTMQGVHVDLIESGRLVCSMKVPHRLVNSGEFLHGGATAGLVDLLGSLVVYTVGARPNSGVSVEINISYFGAAVADEEIEIDSRVLYVGKVIAVVSVELRNKNTGKIIAQGRHTKFLAISNKL